MKAGCGFLQLSLRRHFLGSIRFGILYARSPHSKNSVRKSSRDFAVREVLGIIADNLKKAGWSLGWVSAVDSEGRTIWIADAHRDDGRRFVVHGEEKLNAFLELEAAVCAVRRGP